MSEANELAPAKPSGIVVVDSSPFSNLLDTARFDHLWRVARVFAASDLVPVQFRGKVENCFIGIQMAIRLGVDPFMFLQRCYVIGGKPGIEATIAIGLLNASGRVKSTISYEFDGQGKQRGCTASVIDGGTGEVKEQTVTMAMAEAEGWITKSGSKWKTIPDLMLQYRSAMWLIRTYYPDVILGMYSKDELEDMNTIDVEPVRTSSTPLCHAAARIQKAPSVNRTNGHEHSDPDPTRGIHGKLARCKTVEDVEALRTELITVCESDEAETEIRRLTAERALEIEKTQGQKV